MAQCGHRRQTAWSLNRSSGGDGDGD